MTHCTYLTISADDLPSGHTFLVVRRDGVPVACFMTQGAESEAERAVALLSRNAQSPRCQ